MLLRRILIENVRSFLDRREMKFDGPISIIIGPNGSGKTNLLDIAYIMLRRYLFATRYISQYNDGTPDIKWQLQNNDQLNHMVFEKHSLSTTDNQLVEIEVEVSKDDLDNMRLMQAESSQLQSMMKRIFINNPWEGIQHWEVDKIPPGARMTFSWAHGSLQPPTQTEERNFLEYLQLYEFDNEMRAEVGKASLKMSMIYLPVNRSGGGFQSVVSLANYNDVEQKKRV